MDATAENQQRKTMWQVLEKKSRRYRDWEEVDGVKKW